MRLFFRNFGYTFSSNLISTLISSIVVLILPKVIGTSEYGYVQLYTLYCSYVAFLHLGVVDGIYLRHGGEYYDDLDKKLLSSEFFLFFVIEFIFGSVVFVVGVASAGEPQDAVLAMCIGVAVVLVNTKAFLQYIFQCTARMKEYSCVVSIERIVYLVLVLAGLLLGIKEFYYIVLFDLLGRFFALVYAAKQAKELIFVKPKPSIASIRALIQDIRCGLSLTFSYLVSISIVSVIRLSIEKAWNIETFAKVSLSFSVSNMLLMFIRAIAQVLFPLLRRTNEEMLSSLYNTMRTCLMIPLLGMLVCYYPAKVILSAWLPQYADSLVYMALLFPMCVFESKMSMLIETYMKTLRKEKWLLLVNVVTVSLSVITTLITTYWLHNLDLAVASIVFLLAFRCVFAELLLSTMLDVNVKMDIALELALTAIFIVASWFVGGIAGLSIYAVAYLIYLFMKRKDVAFVANMALRVVRRA